MSALPLVRRLAIIAVPPLAWCVAAPGIGAARTNAAVPGIAAGLPIAAARGHTAAAGSAGSAAASAIPPAAESAGRDGATTPALEPFAAVYALKWHGFTAGRSTLTLSKTGADEYQYRSVNRARGLFRLAFPDGITETSRLRIEDGRVQPLAFEEAKGPGDSGRDVSLEFDWNRGRVRGTQHGKAVDQPLPAGTQDPLSVQVELMRELAAGEDPARFLLFDEDAAKLFDYTRERTERIDTALGSLDTVVYRSDRPGSDRVVRLWLAPSLGFLPVRAERTRGGKMDIELEILSVANPARVSASASGLR